MFNDEISPEEVDLLIDEAAEKIMKSELEDAAILLLGISYPFTYMGAQFSRIFISPYSLFFGRHEESFNKYVSIFEKRENMRKLMNKVEVLMEDKRKQKKEEDERNSDKGRGSKLLRKIRNFLDL